MNGVQEDRKEEVEKALRCGFDAPVDKLQVITPKVAGVALCYRRQAELIATRVANATTEAELLDAIQTPLVIGSTPDPDLGYYMAQWPGWLLFSSRMKVLSKEGRAKSRTHLKAYALGMLAAGGKELLPEALVLLAESKSRQIPTVTPLESKSPSLTAAKNQQELNLRWGTKTKRIPEAEVAFSQTSSDVGWAL
jgi:hypothetical protein